MYSHNARSVKLHTTESVPCMICLCAKFCLRQTNGLLADMFAQTDTLGLSRGVLVCIKHMNYSFILLFRAIHFGDSWEGFWCFSHHCWWNTDFCLKESKGLLSIPSLAIRCWRLKNWKSRQSHGKGEDEQTISHQSSVEFFLKLLSKKIFKWRKRLKSKQKVVNFKKNCNPLFIFGTTENVFYSEIADWWCFLMTDDVTDDVSQWFFVKSWKMKKKKNK